ncbi:hypothetical protein HDU91_003689 [Kappamyces sp. JEL0680]|nr:hypothetical protein HDU91_003689 [Kappamyces sp. JEL0680]
MPDIILYAPDAAALPKSTQVQQDSLLELDASLELVRPASVPESDTTPLETSSSVRTSGAFPLVTDTRNPHVPTAAWRWYAILALLNCQCLFQYPITYAMWAYLGKADQRPAWIVGVFLPLSFLCGVISGVWPGLISKKRRDWEREQRKQMLAGSAAGTIATVPAAIP